MRRRRRRSSPACLIFATSRGAPIGWSDFTPQPILVTPAFSIEALISLALPLFIVTMASQNLPGLAVLAAYDYRPAPGPLIATTGLFTLLAAPFGGHAVNLSAITAALCAAPDAHPDPAKRWIAAAASGAAYIVLGLLAGAMTRFRRGLADPDRGGRRPGAARRLRLLAAQCARRSRRARGGAGDLSHRRLRRHLLRHRRRLLGA